MNLSLRQLHAFREVMRSGSISEAARALGRTQPAVSSLIANLEDELGFCLFDRIKGRLVARPEAHYFLEEAEEVLNRLAQSQRTMADIGSLKRGDLRIACLPAASGIFMPGLVARFLKDKPDVSVSLMMRSSAVVEEWIAAQQYDVGLAETLRPRPAVKQQIFELKAVCALPKGHRMADAEAIEPAHLEGEAAATLFAAHPVAIATRKRFSAANVVFKQRFELQTFMPALELVRQGLCYCICDPVTAISFEMQRGGQGGIVFRPFRPDVPFSISILTPAHRPISALAREFAEIVANDLRDLETGLGLG